MPNKSCPGWGISAERQAELLGEGFVRVQRRLTVAGGA